MTTQLLAVLASLAAAVAWGSGDFGGGLAARRLDSLRVVILAQIIGTAGLLGFTLLSGDPLPDDRTIAWAAVAGLGGGFGLVALYQALAIGPMGVVAPLTAVVSGVVPVVLGIALEGWPSPWQIGGFLLAIVAVWLVSSPGRHQEPVSSRALLLSVLSGLGFTVFLTILAQLGDEGARWPLVFARFASIAFLAVLLVVRSTPRTAEPIPWLLIVLAGVGDTAGNVLFVVATQLGRLDIAAVISSLYPAATVLLARAFLNERLAQRQIVGVVLTLIAFVLIAI